LPTVLVALGVLGLLVAIVLPILSRMRENARKTLCASNLKGIGTGCCIHINIDDVPWYPQTPHRPAEETLTGFVDYTQAIGSYRGRSDDPQAGDTALMSPYPNKLSTSRNLWTLIRAQGFDTKYFVCPSSDDEPNSEANPKTYWDFGEGDITGPVTTDQAAKLWHQISYGYQIPYGKLGQPSIDLDSRMGLIADKGPYGAAIDAGHAAPPPIVEAPTTPEGDWQRWNSPNHGGQGQNVLYPDGHSEFWRGPGAGVDHDDIYTQQSGDGSRLLDRLHGSPPTLAGRQTPASQTDSFIYP
jgi:hypothetical protein